MNQRVLLIAALLAFALVALAPAALCGPRVSLSSPGSASGTWWLCLARGSLRQLTSTARLGYMLHYLIIRTTSAIRCGI